MNLTKRLYRLDEVRAAFLYCLRSRIIIKSIFWLRELEDSCFGGEARRLLLISWVMNVGLARMSWLVEWCSNAGTREGRHKLCLQLLQCSERDSSIWLLLWSGVIPIDTGLSSLIDRWNSTCHLDIHIDDARFEALGHDMRRYIIFAKATACCLKEKTKSSSWVLMTSEEPQDLQKNIETWDTLDIRHGRIYEIPNEALFGMAWRGLGHDTSDEINSIQLEDAPFWKRELVKYKESEWISDDLKEEFHQKYFPSDIPDEWSLAEKKKSHGLGAICKGTYAIWWKRWISDTHIWIWGSPVHTIMEWMKGQEIDESVLDRLCSLYLERLPKSVTAVQKTWILKT